MYGDDNSNVYLINEFKHFLRWLSLYFLISHENIWTKKVLLFLFNFITNISLNSIWKINLRFWKVILIKYSLRQRNFVVIAFKAKAQKHWHSVHVVQYKWGLCWIHDIFGRGRSYCVWYTRPMSDANCKHTTPQTPYAFCIFDRKNYIIHSTEITRRFLWE
jgi:hypothetical protein